MHCSTLNYKDALALTGAPGVVRAYPIVPGIDYVGTVMHDRSAKLARGTKVCVLWMLWWWWMPELHGFDRFKRVLSLLLI